MIEQLYIFGIIIAWLYGWITTFQVGYPPYLWKKLLWEYPIGSIQTRVIVAYNPDTKVITVDDSFAVQPDANSTFMMQ